LPPCLSFFRWLASDAPDARRALTAATINAAWSLGLGSRKGSLETGKEADFLIHEFSDYRELAYYIAAPFRPRVFIAGREVNS
jgi:imidazolonepropionase